MDYDSLWPARNWLSYDSCLIDCLVLLKNHRSCWECHASCSSLQCFQPGLCTTPTLASAEKPRWTTQLLAVLCRPGSKWSAQPTIRPWHLRIHISPGHFRLKSAVCWLNMPQQTARDGTEVRQFFFWAQQTSFEAFLCPTSIHSALIDLTTRPRPTMSQPPAAPHARAVCMKKPEPLASDSHRYHFMYSISHFVAQSKPNMSTQEAAQGL